jgi:hypothetical protein
MTAMKCCPVQIVPTADDMSLLTVLYKEESTMSEAHQDWRVIHGGADVLIEGPGHLKMVLRSFSPAKITHASDAPEQGAETAPPCVWQYPMAPNRWLKLLSPAGQQGQTYHLQLGDDVTWEVPADFADHLQAVHELIRE